MTPSVSEVLGLLAASAAALSLATVLAGKGAALPVALALAAASALFLGAAKATDRLLPYQAAGGGR